MSFAPWIRIIDWLTTDKYRREIQRHTPGFLGIETLAAIKEEAAAGAREVGGNNRGPWIAKYGGKQGQSWCGRVIRWCCENARKRIGREQPVLPNTGGARKLFRAAVAYGWLVDDGDQLAGDLVLFDRGVLGRPEDAWKAHIGILDDDPEYYWAGNEGGFPAVLERHWLSPTKRKRLVGFARLP